MDNNELKFSKVRFFILLILILIGVGLCIELSIIFFKANFLDIYKPSFCSVSDLIDCDGVAKTSYSVAFGVPNALWGMFLYIVMLFLLFVDRIQRRFKNTIFDVFKNPRCYIATLSLLAFVISLVLAGISIFKIHKICALCFCTYFVDLFLAIVARGKGFFIDDIKSTVVDFIDGAKKYFILFIIVLLAFITSLYYLDKTMIVSPKLKKERSFNEFFRAETNKYAVKGNILGKKNAKVVINVYSDYNCPFCRVTNIMLHKLAKEEKVLINEYNFPLDTSCNSKIFNTLGGHETSCMYAKYAVAAEKQDKFWGVANVIFDRHPATHDDIVNELKKAHINMDFDKLKQDVNSPEVNSKIESDIVLASNKNINGTPAIEINGELIMGALPYDDLVKKVREVKKTAGK